MICGDLEEFRSEETGELQTVQCSLPEGHAEAHSGRVWWPDEPRTAVPR